MRSLIAIFALLLSMLGSTAQTTQPRHGSTAGDEYAAQIVSIISQMPHAKLIATESEQGIDELDSLYCLNFYDDYTRFTQKIITMLVMSVIFMLIGFFLTRRRKYASL